MPTTDPDRRRQLAGQDASRRNQGRMHTKPIEPDDVGARFGTKSPTTEEDDYYLEQTPGLEDAWPSQRRQLAERYDLK